MTFAEGIIIVVLQTMLFALGILTGMMGAKLK